jgi:hypothetical protein
MLKEVVELTEDVIDITNANLDLVLFIVFSKDFYLKTDVIEHRIKYLAKDFSPKAFRFSLVVLQSLDERCQSGGSDLLIFIHHQRSEVS